MRFKLAHFSLQPSQVAVGNVRRIGDDQVERGCSWSSELSQTIGNNKIDAICNGVAFCISLRDSESVWGNIDGNNPSPWKFMGQSDRDAARAGTDVANKRRRLRNLRVR